MEEVFYANKWLCSAIIFEFSGIVPITFLIVRFNLSKIGYVQNLSNLNTEGVKLSETCDVSVTNGRVWKNCA